jgi:hypothetical protein
MKDEAPTFNIKDVSFKICPGQLITLVNNNNTFSIAFQGGKNVKKHKKKQTKQIKKIKFNKSNYFNKKSNKKQTKKIYKNK